MEFMFFSGNHNCVAVISNYVPEEEVTCYTLPETIDSEPKLPPALAKPVHTFIMMVCRYFNLKYCFVGNDCSLKLF